MVETMLTRNSLMIQALTFHYLSLVDWGTFRNGISVWLLLSFCPRRVFCTRLYHNLDQRLAFGRGGHEFVGLFDRVGCAACFALPAVGTTIGIMD